MTSIEIHGHRGSRGTHPENTLPAFEEASGAGADYFELDLQLTSDNVPIVFHDPTVSNRLCQWKDGQSILTALPVRQLLADDMLRFDCGSIANPGFPEQVRLPQAVIPSLDQVLAWRNRSGAEIRPNIEVKIEGVSEEWIPPRPIFVELVIGLLEKYDCLEIAQFQSFDLETVRLARLRAPGLRCSPLFEEDADFAAEAAALGAAVVGPAFRFLTSEKIRACHDRGIKVVPWTVNQEADWERLIRMGVDGIITDYPRKLHQFVHGTN